MHKNASWTTQSFTFFSLLFILWANSTWGYFAPSPLSFEELDTQANIIFKGAVISTKAIKDDGFQEYEELDSLETTFRVISIIKGDTSKRKLKFRYYGIPKDKKFFNTGLPEHSYHFEEGETYIICASSTAAKGTYKHMKIGVASKIFQGPIRCLDERSITTTSIKDSMWSEILVLLNEGSGQDIVNAINILNGYSYSTPFHEASDESPEFLRVAVLNEVQPFMTNPNPEVAQAAVQLIGSYDHYLKKNIGGELYWGTLIEIANSNAHAKTRALAIRALGTVQKPEVRQPLTIWLNDSEASVRSAATLLLTDFPSTETNKQLINLSKDPSPTVRSSVSTTIGSIREYSLLNILNILINDSDRKVRETTTRSLLTLPVTNQAVKGYFQQYIHIPEFYPHFLQKLAQETPELYLDELVEIINEKIKIVWSSGYVPSYFSRDILAKYLQEQTNEYLTSDKGSYYLDTIEDHPGTNTLYIYSFYKRRGLDKRAMAYKKKEIENSTSNIEDIFKRVDDFPSHFDDSHI